MPPAHRCTRPTDRWPLALFTSSCRVYPRAVDMSCNAEQDCHSLLACTCGRNAPTAAYETALRKSQSPTLVNGTLTCGMLQDCLASPVPAVDKTN
jgi:hypothetical protein